MLENVFSKSLKDAFSKLITAGQNVQVRIGNTVQPVVNINNGVLKEILSASTAGNSTVSYTVPDGKVWKIVKGSIWLDTDATAANRIPTFTVVPDFSSLSIYESVRTTAITANQIDYAFLNKAGLMNSGSDSVNISDIKFVAGDVLTFSVSAGVAGDAFIVLLQILEFDTI